MLRHLNIKDFVIVDRLALEFDQGFGTLTGETGAGKSILIDALSLVLGDRADAGMVRAGCDKAEITASFDISQLAAVAQWLAAQDLEGGEELLLRRVIDAGGRSRVYVNGTPGTVQQLKEVGEFLVDIHGQHAHQSLLRPDAQRQLVDTQAGLMGLAAEVSSAWRHWRDTDAALQAAASGSEALQREKEQLEWQVRELETLAFNADEWSELEREHKRLGHAASLMEGAAFALAALADGDGACSTQVDAVASRLEALAEYDPQLQEVATLVNSVQAELGEAVSNLRRYTDRMELDPGRLAEVERRIEAVLACARKYRVQPEALVGLLAQWQSRVAELTETADLEVLTAKVESAKTAYFQLATQLSAGRREAVEKLGQAVSEIMRQLALSNGNLIIALNPLPEGSATGLEQVEFRVSGLAGNDAKPLSKVVSGGELSRISLAIQVVTSRSARVPTLIFDEVDVGIGGGVAEIVGRLLKELGRERQVLCVTHLPQVAARGDWQWQVAKTTRDGQTLSSLTPLDKLGRVEEIARMLGGVEITDITRTHAWELLGFQADPA